MFNKNITKKITVVLACATVVMSLTACGESGTFNNIDPDELQSIAYLSSSQATLASTQANSSSAATIAPSSTNNNKASSSAQTQTDSKASSSAANVKESTLAKAASATTFSGTGYNISAPSGWIQGQSSSQGVDIIIGSPEKDNSGFQPNVNVVVESVSAYPNMDARGYLAAAKNQFANNNSFKMGAEGSCVINGENATTLELEATVSGVSYKVFQTYLVKNGQAYVISYSAGTSSFANLLETEGKPIIASFKFN